MHVQKFEADTMDEALKAIRTELGPDAIILKSVTNKNPFAKKKKIEITAAISEKILSAKSKVDEVLTSEQKESFYQGKTEVIKNTIERYGNSYPNSNRLVKSNDNSRKQEQLEEFLKAKEPKAIEANNLPKGVVETPKNTQYNLNLENRIKQLEERLERLTNQDKLIEFSGINALSGYLRSLEINPDIIQGIIKKVIFQLTSDQLNNNDLVQEIALKEMLSMIKVSEHKDINKGVILLLSDGLSGQTTTSLKLAATSNKATVIRLESGILDKNNEFIEKMFNFPVIAVRNSSEVVSKINQVATNDGLVVVDYKNSKKDINEISQLANGLRRSLDNLEIMVTISSIFDETYNRKIIQNYASLANGLIINHLDLCLNFGRVFNLVNLNNVMPLKFFGTGQTIPDDLEAATAERIIAGMFKF